MSPSPSLVLWRPFRGMYPVTQPYANLLAAEPAGYRAPDGSIDYSDASGQPGHWHNGIDYGLPCGTQLLAPADGVVVAAGISPSGFGLRLMIDHGQDISLYGHLTAITVSLDQKVTLDQDIATSGGGNHDQRDGNSSGCHLHWSVLRKSDGHYVNPASFMPSNPAPSPAPSDSGPTATPGTDAALHVVGFEVRPQPGPVRIMDGPDSRLVQLGTMDHSRTYPCDAWMRGMVRHDDKTGHDDNRWYHLEESGWVPSARVAGNAPNSTPL